MLCFWEKKRNSLVLIWVNSNSYFWSPSTRAFEHLPPAGTHAHKTPVPYAVPPASSPPCRTSSLSASTSASVGAKRAPLRPRRSLAWGLRQPSPQPLRALRAARRPPASRAATANPSPSPTARHHRWSPPKPHHALNPSVFPALAARCYAAPRELRHGQTLPEQPAPASLSPRRATVPLLASLWTPAPDESGKDDLRFWPGLPLLASILFLMSHADESSRSSRCCKTGEGGRHSHHATSLSIPF
jgi:hypothetical protein